MLSHLLGNLIYCFWKTSNLKHPKIFSGLCPVLTPLTPNLAILLILSHGYSISTRFKLHLEGSFLLPWHSNLSHTFRGFFSLCSWSFLSILSFILIWSLFFRRLWGAGRSNCSVFLVPKPAIIKHYDIGASTVYLYEDFLVPFIQYED